MRILVGSDFHGLEEAFIKFSDILSRPEYDIGILAGDLTTYVENKTAEEEKLMNILSQSKKHVLFIMGNDDGILENDWSSKGKLLNVNMKRVKFNGYYFIGYSYTNPYVGGKFEKNENEQKLDYNRMLKWVAQHTILITHGPAYGIKDKTIDGKNVGSESLKSFIEDERIILHCCGHIHNDSGFENKTINIAYPKTREFADITIPEMIVKLIK